MNRKIDLLALFAGLLFMVMGALFLLDQRGTMSLDSAVVAPVSLIVFGVGAALSTRDR